MSVTWQSQCTRFDKHVFVCTHHRADKPDYCCSTKGAAEILAQLKQTVKASPLSGQCVRVNGSGCLDACESGVTLVIYPQAIWYYGVTLADIPEIITTSITGNGVVGRLTKRSGATSS